ncbi:hypothetical protein LCGC14_0553680 [marine sediment metagenome]|uniref:Uncharacterized protein n=1 Tax=marine sediment metagenome TaxID=412755 RepID=A0A0F9UXF7_9ZZZZ
MVIVYILGTIVLAIVLSILCPTDGTEMWRGNSRGFTKEDYPPMPSVKPPREGV